MKSQHEQLSLAEFLLAVGQLKFRGTSVLFRLKKSTLQLLAAANAVVRERNNVKNKRNDNDEFELAAHTVKVKRSGAVSDISTLWEIDGATTPSLFVKNTNTMFGMDHQNQNSTTTRDGDDAGATKRPRFGRIESVDFFNQKSQPNEMINALRYFEKPIKEHGVVVKESFNWGKVDMVSFAKCLLVICSHAKELLMKEDRLLRINAPCYIMG